MPNREEIEKNCKEFYEGIIAKKDTSAISVKLNQILFSQISAGIKNKRLTIVADGILQFIPFANLVENETVTLPSASVLAELRQKPFQSTEKTIEIFADPVFAENDVRLANAKKETKPLKSSAVGGISILVKIFPDFYLQGLKQTQFRLWFLKIKLILNSISMPTEKT